MFKSDYKWQHDYVRLALDTGFSFERHKTDNFDKNKISSIDIDRLIEERDIAAVEKLIPSVTKFVLDQEQAQILDNNFVKTFLLSQLIIQYLLYCKKYLDNTLVLVKEEVKKLKEENSELNLFVEDLKGHISDLMKEIDEKPAFRCGQCNKIFSTEEFLASHIKRRHTAPETDTLHMEIKELKGRLNDAEKMIHKEQTEENELKKIEELQQKFEDLRLQVQSELKILQSQHNFQDKYEKLFEKMTQQRIGFEEGKRRESTTQTDLDSDVRDVSKNIGRFEETEKENIPDIANTQKQMTELGEALETKVTSSLQKIEKQMQSFWSKLNEMERYKKNDFDEEVPKQKPEPMVRSKAKHVKLDIVEEDHEDKKLNKPVKESPVQNQPAEKIESGVFLTGADDDTTTSETTASESQSPEEQQPKPKKPVLESQKKPVLESQINASESDSVEEIQPKPTKPLPVPRKRPPSRVTIDDELLQHFRVEVERIILGRLQELGVSPEWKGLPTRSFQRALEIVNHQASLMKKTYPNFDTILTQIERNVNKNIEETKPRKKLTKTRVKSSPKIEIKNRRMYDTDSESDSKPKPKALNEFSVPYSAVIEELKSVTSKIDPNDGKNEDQTKGVLKSYPSVGSLAKKKVLFNLETEKKDVSSKETGSTTSVASSVFDPTPRKEDSKKKDKEKDIEDLSDFDFSDM